MPSTKTDYWTPKLVGNAERDKSNAGKIEHIGLRVLVIWECETKCTETVVSILKRELIDRPN